MGARPAIDDLTEIVASVHAAISINDASIVALLSEKSVSVVNWLITLVIVVVVVILDVSCDASD